MKLDPLRLSFRDLDLETEFRHTYDYENRRFNQVGILLSYLTWVVMIVFTYFNFPQNFLKVTVVIALALFPIFTFVMLITSSPRYIKYYQVLTAVANGIAGFVFIYVGYFVLDKNIIAISGIIAATFFAFLILRLRFRIALFTTLLYVAAYQLTLLMPTGHKTGDIALLSAILWLIEPISIVSGYILERSSRQIFYQNKVIEQQKQQILAEQQKTESLLCDVLPETIVERLKDSPQYIADLFLSASVLFADIVNFTSISERWLPEDTVKILNELFSLFDELVDKHGLEKIKTIGDAYMVASGVPIPREDHAKSVAGLAMDMLAVVEIFRTKYKIPFNIRIGINSGPVVAGVIGKKRFLYDLWGDTVNTASRMESHGLPGKIQVTKETYELIQDEYLVEERGSICIKGKGEMTTYWLVKPK